MPPTTFNRRQRQKAGTAAAWTSANPILLLGELGLETDTGLIKQGDGVTAWSSLPYRPGFTVAAPLEFDTATGILSIDNSGDGGTVGDDTIGEYPPPTWIPPGSGGAIAGNVGDLPTYAFDDTVDESVIIQAPLPPGKNITGGVEVDIFWTTPTTNTGAGAWDVAFDNPSTTGSTPGSWGATVRVATNVSGTTGGINRTTIAVPYANMVSLQRGGLFRMRVRRVASNGSDTLVGDAHLLHVRVTGVSA